MLATMGASVIRTTPEICVRVNPVTPCQSGLTLWSVCAGGVTIGPMTPTVLIVDDHEDFRAFARRLLEAGGLKVVGEAGDAASALSAAQDLGPQLIVLDIKLPDAEGLDIARQLGETSARPAVVLVSSRDAGDYGARIEQSGARGFIPKAELSAARLLALLGMCL